MNVIYKFNETYKNVIQNNNKVLATQTTNNIYLSDFLINTSSKNDSKLNKGKNDLQTHFISYLFIFNKKLKNLVNMNIIFNENPENQIIINTTKDIISEPILLVMRLEQNDDNEHLIVYFPFSNDFIESDNMFSFYYNYIIKKT